MIAVHHPRTWDWRALIPPGRRQETPPPREAAAPAASRPLLQPPGTVAVFDDDVRFIRYVERVLAFERLAVVPVTTIDEHEAVRVVAEARCAAALVDLRMYGDAMAGFRFVEVLRQTTATSRLPVCLVTAELPELRRRRELVESYDCAVLPKPFGPDELLAALGITAPATPVAEPATSSAHCPTVA
jgi:CheY-like chemotaxis protein